MNWSGGERSGQSDGSPERNRRMNTSKEREEVSLPLNRFMTHENNYVSSSRKSGPGDTFRSKEGEARFSEEILTLYVSISPLLILNLRIN